MFNTLVQIAAHTPIWVFAIFAALLLLGLRQMLTRQVGLRRTAALPCLFIALSGWGVLGLGGDRAMHGLVWLVALAAAAALIQLRPLRAAARYDSATRTFTTLGSAAPLLVMLSIFLIQYAVGYLRATDHSSLQDSQNLLMLCLLYGTLCGVLAGRALRLLRLALAQRKSQTAVAA